MHQTQSPPVSGNIEDMPRNILFVAYPDVSLLDLAGPQTVFWAASNYARARGMAGYKCHTTSFSGGMVATVEGTAMSSVSLASFDLRVVDTVIVPGSPTILEVARNETALIDWLAQAASKTRRMASVCSGAFLLAFAGLLDGKRATIHWANHDSFIEEFEEVTLTKSVFVIDGNRMTTAGGTSAIDLMLKIIASDLGEDIATQVADQNYHTAQMRWSAVDPDQVIPAEAAHEGTPEARVSTSSSDPLASRASVSAPEP